jgi:hypothetical protein
LLGGSEVKTDSKGKEGEKTDDSKEKDSKLKSIASYGGLPVMIRWITLITILGAIFYFWSSIEYWVSESDTDQWWKNLLDLPILTVVQDNYGWIGLALIIIGMNTKKPKGLQGAGWVLMLVAIFSTVYSSGYAEWTRDKVAQGSTILSCDVDPTKPKCVRLAKREEAERTAKLARKYQERLRQETYQAQLAAAKQAATEAARPKIKDAPPGEPCGGAFKELKGCESIVFGRNEKRDHVPPIAFCSVGDGPISMKDIGGGEYRWTPNAENVRGRVFSLKVGESFGGFTCGKSNP